MRLLTTITILLLVSSVGASPAVLTNQESPAKTTSQLVKDAAASYDKKEYALAASRYAEKFAANIR